MARGVNSVTLIGNLGADPDIRYLPNGTMRATFSMATSENRKNANDEWEEHTEWHRVSYYGRRAEVARDYLHKGSRVYVSGKLRTRSWDDNGTTRYMTEVNGRDLLMLDGRDGNKSESPGKPPANDTPDGMDDDLPF